MEDNAEDGRVASWTEDERVWRVEVLLNLLSADAAAVFGRLCTERLSVTEAERFRLPAVESRGDEDSMGSGVV